MVYVIELNLRVDFVLSKSGTVYYEGAKSHTM